MALRTVVWMAVTAITLSCAAIHFPDVSSKASSSHSHTIPIWCGRLKLAWEGKSESTFSSHTSYHCHDIIEILLRKTTTNQEQQTIILFISFRQQTDVVWCLFEFHVLPAPNVISTRVPTGDKVPSWVFYSAPPLGNPSADTMTWYPTQSLYPDTELTSPCPILIVSYTRLGSDK